jgi:hypothetical protein
VVPLTTSSSRGRGPAAIRGHAAQAEDVVAGGEAKHDRRVVRANGAALGVGDTGANHDERVAIAIEVGAGRAYRHLNTT